MCQKVRKTVFANRVPSGKTEETGVKTVWSGRRTRMLKSKVEINVRGSAETWWNIICVLNIVFVVQETKELGHFTSFLYRRHIQ